MLEIYEASLLESNLEKEIVRWLVSHYESYERQMFPLIQRMNFQHQTHAYLKLQISRVVELPNDINVFCETVDSVTHAEIQDLINRSLVSFPDQNKISCLEFELLAQLMSS